MGTAPFYSYVDGDDLETAFRSAVDDAEAKHGLDSAFVGKDTVVVIADDPMSEESARTAAKSLVQAATRGSPTSAARSARSLSETPSR